MKTPLLALAATLVILVATALPALAHPHATIVEANGARCYVVTDGFAALDGKVEPQYWIETNGVLTGGVARGAVSEEAGLPVAGLPYWDLVGEFVFGALGQEPGDVHEFFEDGASGLQRLAGAWGPADTRVDASTWAKTCLA